MSGTSILTIRDGAGCWGLGGAVAVPGLPGALAAHGRREEVGLQHEHSFDVAREGYVNLLLAGQRRSRQPGDSPEMVLARQRFLATGAYDPMSEAIPRSWRGSGRAWSWTSGAARAAIPGTCTRPRGSRSTWPSRLWPRRRERIRTAGTRWPAPGPCRWTMRPLIWRPASSGR